MTTWFLMAAAATCGLFAQAPETPLSFEVATIKASAPPADGRVFRGVQYQSGGGFRAGNVTLQGLVTFAYRVRDFQISGGPAWINSDLYDIQARSPSSAAPATDPRSMTDEQRKVYGDQMAERVRSLLAERFQLVVHHETKEEQVYALVVGKSGPKFRETNETGPDRGRMRMGRAELDGTGVQLSFLALTLSNQLGRPVLDKTGLSGNYDLNLTWAPELGQAVFGPPGAQASTDPNGPSIFAAVQEQLGLRLESQKAPVDIIAIDRAEKPSEN